MTRQTPWLPGFIVMLGVGLLALPLLSGCWGDDDAGPALEEPLVELGGLRQRGDEWLLASHLFPARYAPALDATSLQATLNGEDISGHFEPQPGEVQRLDFGDLLEREESYELVMQATSLDGRTEEYRYDFVYEPVQTGTTVRAISGKFDPDEAPATVEEALKMIEEGEVEVEVEVEEHIVP